jgi:hypothetical protein
VTVFQQKFRGISTIAVRYFSGIRGSLRQTVSAFFPDTFKNSRSFSEVSKFFQIVMCRNQGLLIEYMFLVSRRHKDLKESVQEFGRGSAESQSSYDDLLLHAYSEFFKVANTNFDLLSEYFVGRSSELPRLCLKGNLLRGDENCVITVFRDEKVSYESGYDINENTGFQHCFSTGQYYLENDIPSAVLAGRYRNPRISNETARNIYTNSLIARRETLVSNWPEVWVGSGGTERNAYQSTLIVPITLWNNNMSKEFLEKYGAEDAERVIFGFLCFDHVSSGFFNSSDVDVGYFVADLLSLFSYNLFNYTAFSETANSVNPSGQGDLDERIEREKDLILREIEGSVSSKMGTIGKKSNKNKLLSMKMPQSLY